MTKLPDVSGALAKLRAKDQRLYHLTSQSNFITKCADTAYKYRMVHFGLAWKINIKYNIITNSDSYTKITFIMQIFLQVII